MDGMGKFSHVVSLSGIPVLLAWVSAATPVWQYEGAGASSNVWHAAGGGNALTALHDATNGWRHAEVRQFEKHRAVGFPEGASAFAFHDGATNRVAAVFAVARCETPGAMATLLDAPYNVCVRLNPERPFESFPRWQGEQLGFRASYRVNGVETDVFAPSPEFRLVEVRFETPPVMNGLCVGNAAASPLWLRHWPGEIAELLFFTREPTEEEQHAVHHYLRLKYGIPLAHGRVDTAAVLDRLGIRRGALFGSIFMVR